MKLLPTIAAVTRTMRSVMPCAGRSPSSPASRRTDLQLGNGATNPAHSLTAVLSSSSEFAAPLKWSGQLTSSLSPCWLARLFQQPGELFANCNVKVTSWPAVRPGTVGSAFPNGTEGEAL